MGKIYLLLKEFFGNFLITFILSIVTLISVVCVSMFILILMNFSKYIDKTFSTKISPDIIKVSPKPTKAPKINLFGIKLKQPEGTYIDDEVLAKIKKIKGVKEVSPLLASRIPMQVIVSIFGLNYGSDLICIGVEYNLISDDLLKDKKSINLWKNWKEGNEIPVLIPEILFQAYNSSMAEPNNLPKVSKEMLIGIKLKLNIGKSSLKTFPHYSTEQAIVSGFTDKVANICLVVPIRVMRHFNEKFNVKSEYIHLYVKVDGHESVLSVSDKIKKMGLMVEADKTLSEEIIKIKSIVNIIGNVLITLIIIIASISIAFGSVVSVSNRFEYYKILRILGASRSFIAISIVIKYALMGFIASIIALNIVDILYKNLLSNLIQIGISNLNKEIKDKIILFSTLIPAVFSIFGVLKLYNKKEVIID